MTTMTYRPKASTRRLGNSDLTTLLQKAAKQATSQPRLVGHGEPEFSTCLAVDVHPRIVWDTNGFYRALNVPVDASRRQLAAAYLSGDGHSSIRLTHIIKTLLHPVLRSRYDCTPIGMLWADDPDLYQAISEAVEDGQVVFAPESDWAIYSLGLSDKEIDWTLAEAWVSAIAVEWGHSDLSRRMSVGICLDEFGCHLRVVGKRCVAFLPMGVAPKDAREYASLLAASPVVTNS